MIKKTLVVLFLFLTTFVVSGYRKPEVYTIDAQKNAVLHNNLGLKAVEERSYLQAVQEFNLAINLNPKTQATAVYYNNLGEVYMKIGYFDFAQNCFERAITQYNLNFLFYKNLVDSFKAQKLVGSKIKLYEKKKDNNPLNMVTLGLLYVANGDIRRGIIKLDEFCMREPDLLITGAVRSYIKELVAKNR